MGRDLDRSTERPLVRLCPSSSHRPCGDQGGDGDKLSPTRTLLEGLHLHPSSEPLDRPGPEGTEPVGPEETSQSSLGPAEAGETEEQVKAVSPGVWAASLPAPCTPCVPHGTLTHSLVGFGDPACSGPAAEDSRTKALQGWEGPEA